MVFTCFGTYSIYFNKNADILTLNKGILYKTIPNSITASYIFPWKNIETMYNEARDQI